MKKIWWLAPIGLVLVSFALVRNAHEALSLGLGGAGLMLFGLVGEALFPKIAWYKRNTGRPGSPGRRVNPDGTPYYTGLWNFIGSSLRVLAFGFIGGMSIDGVVGVALWIFPHFDWGKAIGTIFCWWVGIMIVISIIGGMISK